MSERTGETGSTDFPTTPGAFDPSFNGGNYDAFVVKLALGTPPPSSGLTYVGPLYLPSDTVMVGEADGRITTGDHVHLRLPFRNTGSQPITNAIVKMSGAPWTGSCVGVSVHNGASWLNAQQPVTLTPSTIGPGETGIADFWIYVTDNDPIDRQSLTGQTWLLVHTDSGEWVVRIALSAIAFSISGNEALAAGSCLHTPGNFEIQKFAQYAAGAWTMSTPPTNAGDPDTPEQAIRNLVERVNDEFHYQTRPETRIADTALVAARHEDVGECRHYADLTTGLLRSLNLPARYVTAVFTKGGVFEVFGQTAGHAWVETYLGSGGWRQADATWESRF